MVQLSEAQKDEVAAEVHRTLSRQFLDFPASKSQVRTFVDWSDQSLEVADADLVVRIPAGPLRDFAIANPATARTVVRDVLDKRIEVL